jgi:hypothetical protein
MSNTNENSGLKHLFADRKKSLFRIAFASLLVTIFFAIFIEGYLSVDNYLRQYSTNVEVSLVLKSYPDSAPTNNKNDSLNDDTGKYSDSLLTETVNTIVTMPWTKSYKLISSEQANEEFKIRYGEISSELMPVNPFPQILTVIIKNSYHDSFSFNKIISYLKSMELVDEVRYRDDFIKSYFSMKKNLIFASLILAVLITITLIFLLYQTLKTEFVFINEYTKNSIIALFLILSGAIGVIIAEAKFFAVNAMMINQFKIQLTIHNITLIYAPIVSLALVTAMIYITLLFSNTPPPLSIEEQEQNDSENKTNDDPKDTETEIVEVNE